MAANSQTIAAVMINDRTDRHIYNLLQNDVTAWRSIPIQKVQWSGDVAIFGARVERNKSIRTVSGTTEPKAGQQGFVRFTVHAKKVLGKGQIDVATMMAADDAQGSQAVEPMDEIEGIINDFPKKMSFYSFLGGGGLQALSGLTVAGAPIGLIWQRSAVITDYGYTGRFSDIVAQAQAVNFARFIRLDTYVQVGADTLITDLSADLISLNANIDTSVLPEGVPCAVLLVGAASQAFVTSTVSGDNTAGDPCVFDPAGDEVGSLIHDMTGFLSNLTQPIHFGNNRANGATDPKMRRLRSNFLVCANNNVQGGDVLSGIEVDKMAAKVKTASGQNPDAYWMSFTTALAFAQTMVGTNDANMRVMAQGKAQKLDGGAPLGAPDSSDTGYGRSNVPIHGSVDCPDGLALAMHNKAWRRVFQGKPEGFWLGAEGPNKGVLNKTQGESQYEFTRMMLPEQVCLNPLANALLIGIAPVS